MADTDPTPYATHAPRYRAAGWQGVLPIPPRRKSSPPTGFTGANGAYPGEDQVAEWAASGPACNIALRMGPDVIGIDVDDYDGKPGGQTLAELVDTCGELPPTWVSTSRTDRVSGIRFYRLPTPTKLIGSLPGIEIIQRHHRYAVVAPSLHPDGREYRWISPDGEIGDQVPGVDDLPELPAAWLQRLTVAGTTSASRRALATGTTVSPAVDKAYGQAVRGLRQGTRHDSALAGIGALVRLEHLGHPGATDSLTQLRHDFLAAVGDSRTAHEAKTEWDRMIEGATQVVASTPSIAPPWEDRRPEDPLRLVGDSLKSKTGQPAADEPASVAWPPRRPLPETPRPDPPINLFPTWIADQIRNVTRQLGCDPVLPTVFGLGALSVASLGHVRVKIRAGEILRTTGLYLAASGVPATGKSPALAMMFDPVRDHEEACIEQSRADVAAAEAAKSIAEKRAKEAIDGAARTGDPDTEKQAIKLKAAAAVIDVPSAGELMTTNITPEKVAGLMQANGERIAIVSDESGVLVVDRYGDKKSGANMDVYLQGFTGEPVVVHRQAAPPIRMRHPLMAIVAGVQPHALEAAMLNEEFRARGLGPRFLTATTTRLADNTDIDYDVWDHQVGDTYADKLITLARQWSSWRNPATLTIAPDGRQAYSAWAADLRRREAEGGPLEGESGWVSKLRSSTLRIAALLHLADGHRAEDPISADAVHRAIGIAEFFIVHHQRDTSDAPNLARRLAATLAKLATHDEAVDGLVTKRMVARLASAGFRKPDRYIPPLAVLVDAGWVALEPDTLNFAPSTEAAIAAAKAFRVHPELLAEAGQSVGPADVATDESAAAGGPRAAVEAPVSGTRQAATDATKFDAESPDSEQSHSASTNVAYVASVAISTFETPPPPCFKDPEGPPCDSRDAATNQVDEPGNAATRTAPAVTTADLGASDDPAASAPAWSLLTPTTPSAPPRTDQPTGDPHG